LKVFLRFEYNGTKRLQRPRGFNGINGYTS
jgi:hypothetical protein